MSFGAGFAQGLNIGANFARQYRAADKQYKEEQQEQGIKDVRMAALKEAEDARAAAVAARDGIKPDAATTTPAVTSTAATPESVAAPNVTTAPVTPSSTTPAPVSPATATPAGSVAPATMTPPSAGPAPTTTTPAPTATSPAAAGLPAPAATPAPAQAAPAGEAVKPAGVGKAPVGDVMDFFIKGPAQKVQAAYIAAGDLESAEKWGSYIKSKKGEAAIGAWGKSWVAAQRGDWETAAEGFGKYYSDYVADGVDYVGHKTVTDANGNVTGFDVTLKNKDTGKESTMQMTPESLLKMGSAYNPKTLFDMERQDQAKAAETKATMAAEKRKERAAIMLEDRKSENRRIEKADEAQYKTGEIAAKSEADIAKEAAKIRTTLQTKIDLLKTEGKLTPEQIQDEIPRLIIGDSFRKGASPEEAARLALSDRMKDPMFARKTPEEQRKIIQDDIETVRLAGGGRTRSASDPAPRSPAAEGLVQSGNIDLSKRPIVKNKDGSFSTVRSMSFNVDGKEVLVPTVSEDGRIMSEKEAMEQYRKTGKHLGIFKTPAQATAYAKTLHSQQEQQYGPAAEGIGPKPVWVRNKNTGKIEQIDPSKLR